MTPEELDEARAKEAWRLFSTDGPTAPTIAARLAREGWTPPEPADPDLLAFREWAAAQGPGPQALLRAAYLAGARMATKRERERAKVLVECVERYAGPHGAVALAKYNGEW